MASPVMLAIDVVLGALIGPPSTAEIENWRNVALGLQQDEE